MSSYQQVKFGPELISSSREAWLGYYVFVALALLSLGGGYLWLRRSGLEGADYRLGLIGIFVLSLVSLGIAIMCHLLGHVIDAIEDLRGAANRAGSPGQNPTLPS